MASNQQRVREFLRDFTAKAKVWDILFRDDRGKNAQTLLDLELRPVDRKKILLQLQVEDYCDGPIEDQLNKGPQMCTSKSPWGRHRAVSYAFLFMWPSTGLNIHSKINEV